jgi:hypothetical protein
MMLTTYEGVRDGGTEPEFNSMSYLGVVREGEWAVKIFSKERVSDEWLEKMFMGQIGWVYRKEVTFRICQKRVGLTVVSVVECVPQTSTNNLISTSQTRPGILLCERF